MTSCLSPAFAMYLVLLITIHSCNEPDRVHETSGNSKSPGINSVKKRGTPPPGPAAADEAVREVSVPDKSLPESSSDLSGSFESDCENGLKSGIEFSAGLTTWTENWYLDPRCNLASVSYSASYKHSLQPSGSGKFVADLSWQTSTMQIFFRSSDPLTFGTYACEKVNDQLKAGKRADTTSCRHYKDYFTVISYSQSGLRIGLPEGKKKGASPEDRAVSYSGQYRRVSPPE